MNEAAENPQSLRSLSLVTTESPKPLSYADKQGL